MNRTCLVLVALLAAGCTAEGENPASAPSPAPASGAAAPAPDPASGAAAETRAPVRGAPPPEFRLLAVTGEGVVSLADSVKAAAGRPVVLVLGSATCSYSQDQIRDLATAPPGCAVIATASGTSEEVKKTLPAIVPFPVLLDDGGEILAKYRVGATPSVVVLDGAGRIAYIGQGGYLAPAVVADMAARAARGEGIDAGTVKPAGG